MDKWRKDELDNMTCGDVALQVFGAEQELEEAANARAEACRKLAEARNAMDRANELVNEAARHESLCNNEYKALKKYLNDRLNYINN